MPEAGSGAFSPDGTKMVYSPRFRDFRPEKRYGGGQANKLYIYDLATNDAKMISDGPHASRDAMWISNTIYYNSDKDGKFNLYAYDTGHGKDSQVTQEPRLGHPLAVFRRAGANHLRKERRARDI